MNIDPDELMLHANRITSIDTLRREFDTAFAVYQEAAKRAHEGPRGHASAEEQNRAILAYSVMRVSSDALATLLRKI